MAPALLLSAILAAAAAAEGLPLPAGVKLVLPRAAKLEAAWALPPSTSTAALDVLFAVDPAGVAWLILDRQVVSVPEKNALFAADRPFGQIVWIGDKPVVRSHEALGTFEPGPPDGKGLPRVHFKPLTTVPLTSWRLAPAGGEDVYVAGYNPRKRVSQLGLVGPSAEGKLLRVLYETEAQIADVAGDGKTTYFASGPAIWTLGKDGGASVLWAHPKAAIRSIVAAPGGGVFYATDGGVGYAGASARFEFLRAAGCRIAAAGDDLFVLLDGLRGGLLRIRGVSRLARISR